MAAPDSVLKLCETFADHREHYRSGAYNEAQLRKEFLDPFFAALGWDMDNAAGLAPQYRDVIHEDALRVGVHVKAPDYAFTLHGQRKFFLEAKKPAVNIKSDVDPAYQLRRYAWSAKMPLSVLSDFEEFAIYDTRIKPVKGDPSSKSRTFYCTSDQYPEKWDEIAAIFSRDAILKGSFDKYADSNKKKKGTAEVDAEFLAEIERWRDLLARNLALRNPDLSVRDLNFAVQKTIDRLVFLRICEDRGTEDYGRLRSIANGTQTYPRLLELFRSADARYNSGLFHFSKEKGQAEEPDTLTPHLLLDDKVLKDIIVHLYYPDSPYEFSVLPADILGSVYEQFLGKVITLTAGHRATVEDKPEVKKAGGVFYTPAYIVDYIVKQTVGPLIEGKTPKQIESIRVLDPACGSGSFLIVAYQFLLDWYHQYYIVHDPEKLAKGKNPVLVASRSGGWILTTAERKRILLAHIYGVDIDNQAVEVTKLSLLLKVLEGETAQSIQRELIQQRVLPDLGNNIKCGNSLIGSDFYAQPGLPEMDAEAHLRVNVFDWDGKDGFPEIMKAGGFDAVIGNPPYGAEFNEENKRYLIEKFPHQTYQLDSYLIFMEQSITTLLRKNGLFGMIIPNPWLTNLKQDKIRRFVLERARVREIVHFKFPVFNKVIVDTEIVLLAAGGGPQHSILISTVPSMASFLGNPDEPAPSRTEVIQSKWSALNGLPINIFVSPADDELIGKICRQSRQLQQHCLINVGIKPYQTGKGTPQQTAAVVKSRPFDSDHKASSFHLPYLRGRDIGRYRIAPLESRYLKYGPWLAEPRPAAKFDAKEKIVMRQTGDSLVAALDFQQFLCLNNMHVLVPRNESMSPRFLLGIINSRLLNWYYHSMNPEVGEALAEVKKTNVAQLPIRIIDPANKTDVAAHDRIVSLVEKMLELHKQRAAAKTPHEQTALDRQIAAADSQIDRLVYDLYGLTEEEIKLVEGA